MKSFLVLCLLAFSFGAFSKTILFLGDSLTEGYQLSKEEAYPALVETELKKTIPDIKVLNGGVSGATSASGLKRMDWYLKAKPEFMVLALGANDGLRGLKIENTEKNLISVIEKAQERNITVILAGMKMPTNYGEPYRSQFEQMYPRLAKKYNLKLVPFILEGVGGIPKLNLADGIHPNPEGHKIMAQTMLKVLRPLL
jgi:acyl-CoA thioesterase-1